MSGIKAIIFDLDGTLVEFGKDYSWIKVFEEVFVTILKRMTGKDFPHITSARIYDSIRLPYDESTKIFREWGIDDPDGFWKNLEIEDFKVRNKMVGRSILPYHDATELIKEIKENDGSIKCGILTNAPERIARLELESAGFLNNIDYICAFSYNSPNSKPSGWGIERMLSEWNIPKESA